MTTVLCLPLCRSASIMSRMKFDLAESLPKAAIGGARENGAFQSSRALPKVRRGAIIRRLGFTGKGIA